MKPSDEALDANRLCVEHGAACDECRSVMAQESFMDDDLCEEGQRLWVEFLRLFYESEASR